MVTADQLVLHAIGDYVTQSDWMAQKKVSSLPVAVLHAMLYSIPFVLLTGSLAAWLVIFSTHAVIDRWRLARYVVWAKNFMGPSNPPFSECSKTGMTPSRPDFLAIWLLIIVDNLLHVTINAAALRWL